MRNKDANNNNDNKSLRVSFKKTIKKKTATKPINLSDLKIKSSSKIGRRVLTSSMITFVMYKNSVDRIKFVLFVFFKKIKVGHFKMKRRNYISIEKSGAANMFSFWLVGWLVGWVFMAYQPL